MSSQAIAVKSEMQKVPSSRSGFQQLRRPLNTFNFDAAAASPREAANQLRIDWDFKTTLE
jgi:hypothetical protein